jgi:hypothetical protein
VTILILRSAIEDLARGRDFYDQQGEGLGDYFEESLPPTLIPSDCTRAST